MTDRELLERAARAFGIELVWSSDPGWAPKIKGRGMVSWNPLDDDGDALRLAVKLQIAVFMRVDQGRVFAGAPVGSWGLVELLLGNDHEASVRRAIVRAAAALAKVTA